MDWKEEFLKYFDSGKKFSENELRELIEWADRTDAGYEGRWEKQMTSFIEVGSRIFLFDWQRGLTEYQENYYEQPIEVKKITNEKIVKFIEEEYFDKSGKSVYKTEFKEKNS